MPRAGSKAVLDHSGTHFDRRRGERRSSAMASARVWWCIGPSASRKLEAPHSRAAATPSFLGEQLPVHKVAGVEEAIRAAARRCFVFAVLARAQLHRAGVQ